MWVLRNDIYYWFVYYLINMFEELVCECDTDVDSIINISSCSNITLDNKIELFNKFNWSIIENIKYER